VEKILDSATALENLMSRILILVSRLRTISQSLVAYNIHRNSIDLSKGVMAKKISKCQNIRKQNKSRWLHVVALFRKLRKQKTHSLDVDTSIAAAKPSSRDPQDDSKDTLKTYLQYEESPKTSSHDDENNDPLENSESDLCDNEDNELQRDDEQMLDGLLLRSLETYDIQAFRNGKAFLLNRLLKTQENYLRSDTTFRVDCRVDIAYHHTRLENLPTIQRDGLLSKLERAQIGVDSHYNGSMFGDGIYCSPDPELYANTVYGDTTILLARIKGIETLEFPTKQKNYNTVVVKDRNFCVLQNSNQCVPLFHFPSKNLGSHRKMENQIVWEFKQKLADVHQLVHNFLSHAFIASTETTPWVTNRHMIGATAEKYNVKSIQTCTSIPDLLYTISFWRQCKTMPKQLIKSAEEKLETLQTGEAVRYRIARLSSQRQYLPLHYYEVIRLDSLQPENYRAQLDAWDICAIHMIDKKQLKASLPKLATHPLSHLVTPMGNENAIVGDASCDPACQYDSNDQPVEEFESQIKLALHECIAIKKRAQAEFEEGNIVWARALYNKGIYGTPILDKVPCGLCKDRSSYVAARATMLASLYSNRGYTHYCERDFEKCLSDYNLSLLWNPKSQRTYIRKWIALDTAGHVEAALACLQEGYKELPRSKVLASRISLARQKVPKNQSPSGIPAGELTAQS